MQRIKRYRSNLTPEDQRTYRRWTRGLFVSYLVVIGIAIGSTLLRTSASVHESQAQMARLKFAPGTAATPPATLAHRP